MTCFATILSRPALAVAWRAAKIARPVRNTGAIQLFQVGLGTINPDFYRAVCSHCQPMAFVLLTAYIFQSDHRRNARETP
jgi:hypothetical protein